MRKRNKKTWDDSVFKSEKSRKRTMRRRNPFYKTFSGNGNRGRSKYSYQNTSSLPTIIYAPKKMSIQFNTIETLSFFEKLQDTAENGYNVYLDMSKIEFISEDAILYLLSRLHYFKLRYKKGIVQGNFPRDNRCKEFLINSKFTEYVVTETKFIPSEGIFPIVEGFTSDGKIVNEVLSFIDNKITFNSDNKARLYDPIMESLTNSKNHAYREVREWNRWWIMAVPENNDIVHLTILDNGLGIPATIKKKDGSILLQ